MDLSLDHTSEPICEVDVSALREWVIRAGEGVPWIVQEHVQRDPQRLFAWPIALVTPILDRVLAHFPAGCRTAEIVLSRTQPGQYHGLHTDHPNLSVWLTRVHVPILTDERCWHRFEDGERFHLFAGTAWTFNTERRHEFGNGSLAERVHLHWDVLRS